jgi:DNA-binding MurR/RpiR family transcriptional regulator
MDNLRDATKRVDAATEMQTVPRSLSGRIRALYENLSPTDRRLADFMLEYPGDIAGYSASELAGLVSASNAAVSRFVQRLGFRNYEELRVVAREAKFSGSPLYLLEHVSPGFSTDVIQAHLKTNADNMAGTFQQIDPAMIEAIADAIAGARQVWLIGFRNSYFLASYLRWQFIQVRDGVHLLPAAGETLGEYLAGVSPEDVVVIFGLRRRVSEIGQIVAVAQQIGVRIAYIADHGMAVNLDATWLLRCDTCSPGPLDNHVAVLALCHILATQVIELTGAPGRNRLAGIEEMHERLDEF